MYFLLHIYYKRSSILLAFHEILSNIYSFNVYKHTFTSNLQSISIFLNIAPILLPVAVVLVMIKRITSEIRST